MMQENNPASDDHSYDSTTHLSPEKIPMEERLRRLDERFFELHDLVNDPTTREFAAKEKMHLLHQMALEQMRLRPGEVEGQDWKIEELSLLYEKTNTMTHNVEITIGDPSTGPTTILEVHHDVISTNLDENNKIPLEVTDDGEIIGRTVQDNTIHLAATVESLTHIKKPEKGAIVIVFTDFEENGCRGSHAYKERFADKISKKHPVSMIALESVQNKDNNAEERMIAIGHRGKFDGQVIGQDIQQPIDNVFFNFFNSLIDTQWLAYEKGGDLLGHTVGTSTCGTIEMKDDQSVSVWSKIDFRTNGKASASETSATLKENLKNTPRIDELYIIDRAKERIASGDIAIKVENSKITITSESNYGHPSLYNPEADETAIPALYAIVKILKDNKMLDGVSKITWGDETKQNSNPTEATIVGNFEFKTDQLVKAIQGYQVNDNDQNTIPQSTGLSIDQEKEVLTGTVIPRNDKVTQKILRTMLAFPRTMNFMTDIGALFNHLKENYSDIELYPFIFGIGDSSRLHKEERVTKEDRLWLLEALPKFINLIQEQLQQKETA